MNDNSQLLRLCGLWERTSARGTTYLTGRIGSAKVLIMPNRDAGAEDELSHLMFLTPAADKSATNPTARRNADP